jgi:gas vesicle protein
MFRLGLAIGTLAGTAIGFLFSPELARRTRPVAKAVLKAALAAAHETQVHGAQIAESFEDLYAEAKAEVAAEVFAAAVAAAQAKASRANGAAKSATAGVADVPERSSSKARAARKRTPVKRSRPISRRDG